MKTDCDDLKQGTVKTKFVYSCTVICLCTMQPMRCLSARLDLKDQTFCRVSGVYSKITLYVMACAKTKSMRKITKNNTPQTMVESVIFYSASSKVGLFIKLIIVPCSNNATSYETDLMILFSSLHL